MSEHFLVAETTILFVCHFSSKDCDVGEAMLHCSSYSCEIQPKKYLLPQMSCKNGGGGKRFAEEEGGQDVSYEVLGSWEKNQI